MSISKPKAFSFPVAHVLAQVNDAKFNIEHALRNRSSDPSFRFLLLVNAITKKLKLLCVFHRHSANFKRSPR